jgi:hypothetical protein
MQKGRVGREEGEEAKMSLRGGREAVLTIGLPGNATTRHDSSARTHAGGRGTKAGRHLLQRWHW